MVVFEVWLSAVRETGMSVPSPAGSWNTACVWEKLLGEIVTPLKTTMGDKPKLEPVSVIRLPPAVAPVAGVIDVMAGGE